MAKFKVVVHYQGSADILVEAENEDEAKKKAEEAFDEIPEMELIANLADIGICDCWEVEGEEEE